MMTRNETPPEFAVGKRADAGVGEGRRHVLLRLRQRDPCLQAGHGHRAAAQLLRRPLGMDDAPARRHQIHIARRNHHLRAKRIPVADFAVEQIGDGGKADMRMRAHIEHLAGRQDRRAHLVKEDERARPCGAWPLAARGAPQSRQYPWRWRGPWFRSASQAERSPGMGSMPGKKLMAMPFRFRLQPSPLRGRCRRRRRMGVVKKFLRWQHRHCCFILWRQHLPRHP